MNDHFKEITLKGLKAKDIIEVEEIQSLWSGYGSIKRLEVIDGKQPSVIAKHVKMPVQNNHPRGWNTNLSHLRKVKSYEVESNWYKYYSTKCNDTCRIPDCYTIESKGNEVFIVMEDLDASGFENRISSVNWTAIEACLLWLANFHARFLNCKPKHLWDIGTYWHLSTRPDELKVLDDLPLKNAAQAIDNKLNNAKYKSFVHGDAKLANFCFSNNNKNVAMVDFQYVGGGCGMKDVAYFIGSCLYEDDCENLETKILDTYFTELKIAVSKIHSHVNIDELEQEWRHLYPVAWTDFHRFLKGWSPGHWKINSYSERISREVIKDLIN